MVLPFFAAQFAWFLVVWTVLATYFVAPRLRALPPADALQACLVPQLFRVLGIGLLVPNLSPGMPRSFAVPTAMGDTLTAFLALAAIVALVRGSAVGRPLAWACTVVGAADLAVALPHAAAVGAALFMTAQWYVPALGVPLMIVSHVLAVRTLLRTG